MRAKRGLNVSAVEPVSPSVGDMLVRRVDISAIPVGASHSHVFFCASSRTDRRDHGGGSRGAECGRRARREGRHRRNGTFEGDGGSGVGHGTDCEHAAGAAGTGTKMRLPKGAIATWTQQDSLLGTLRSLSR